MSRIRIKIDGITRAQDGVAAAQAGADAIGMVFYPKARRCISLERAREILRALPALVTPVGLFVDQEAEEIRRVMGELGLRHVQLHGREEPALVAALREFAVLKAIKAGRDTLRAELDLWRESIESLKLTQLKAFVLDTPGTAAAGGTGVENDWEAVAAARQEGAFDGLPRIIAAGGLRPENVAKVIHLIRPYAVDVSSGVEENFGEKSAEKIRAFIQAAAPFPSGDQ
jgi:phosphoribosylanthranilate isomerase